MELESEAVVNMLATYDQEIKDKLTIHNEVNDFRLYREDEDIEQELVDTDAAAIIIDEIENDAYDELLLTEPILQRMVN